ncbi:MAG: GAF domain-containing sensor histidine kinase [Armatimonadota bacterium]|nr:GAF domain-containing sensor histidine kinase [Armatimonadota bacterium]
MNVLPESLPVLSIGVGIHAAVTLFLLLRYLESRERLVGWWTGAYLLFTLHILAEGWVNPTAPLWILVLRHSFFLASSWTLTVSFVREAPAPPLARWTLLFALLAAAALSMSAFALKVGWRWPWGAIPPSVIGGAGFLTAAFLFRRSEGWSRDLAGNLLFWGMVLTGLHALDYPFLRSDPLLSTVGAGLSGLFTLAFGFGIVLQAWHRTRELTLLHAVAEALNRSLNVRETLGDVLRQISDRLGLLGGWMYLWSQERGEYVPGPTYSLPEVLVRDPVALEGECRCLQMLVRGELAQVIDLECERLEQLQFRITNRHVTVPLRTSERTLGLMNFVVPPRRALMPRELEMLSAIGFQVGMAIERTRLYEEVLAKEAVRTELLEKIISAQEDERRRIARELHDEAGQALTALILNLEMTEESLPDTNSQIREQLRHLRELAEHTLGEIRKLIYDLRPTILDDLGLNAAIRWYLKNAVEPRGISVELEMPPSDRRLPHHVETAIFRIIQEALNNVVKHAQASKVRVEVHYNQAEVRVSVTDNGKGFNVGAILARSDGGRGVGLLGMQERASLLGGKFSIASAPGRGTRVELVLPLTQGTSSGGGEIPEEESGGELR